jgi:hypothetical protein
MRVLLMENEPWAADEAAYRLELAGHDVQRCFERNIPSLPCFGFRDASTCPLLDGKGDVDVAVTVRTPGWREEMTLEQGVRCAVRRGVPLVVAGAIDTDPFVACEMVTINGTDRILDACEAAIATAQGC